ncbi:sulfate ABC transporter substrate-binding protein [Phormidium sp. FACHB-592]|uniref:Sulfate ABC transporter substrate-binding protein n=1 Tax=Stenomitos frigidus AS-A4 TaxID=2933935 RepID=A0ABV0KH10_9CYAN|nr:sulfate ABC transporter substrate-binding protein [Phormidium sp. FACHB-592]MBD2073830.1 sulfate ABC transporter substrate-binding protein [Phormidium sp. FACHB-592]
MTVRQRAPKPLGNLIHYFTDRLRFTSFRQFVSLFVVGAVLSLSIAACSSGNNATTPAAGGSASPVADQKKDVELTLVAYAVPKEAHDAIIPKFVEKWKTEKGQNVTFNQSYGGSGSQTRAIIDGLEADVVNLALGADVLKLVKAELVSPDWSTKVPNNGIVGETVVAVTTREGNPKNIKTFADLTRDDVKWVTADPKTSGGARWNFLALWDYNLKTGGNEAKAKEFVAKAYKNVVVLAKDARESTDAFAKQGQGDALLNYENEVILAKNKGEKLDYVVPEVNFSIDIPVAVVDKNVDKHGTREVAEAFVQYLFTPEAQEEFIKLGFRPLAASADKNKELAAKYPPVKTLGTIKEFGGWEQAQDKYFGDKGVFDEIRAAK